jgi:hypothetical protein
MYYRYMASHEEVRGIIERLRQDPSLADELRSVLLTDELLRLPERFSAFVAEVRAFVEATNSRLGRLEGDVGMLKGGHFETKWLRHASGYLMRHGFFAAQPVDQVVLLAKVREALSSGALERSDVEDLLLADAVLLAERDSDGSDTYLVCEVSSRLHTDDIARASRRASVAARLDGTPAAAVAAGASIDEAAAALAEREGVAVVIPGSWRTAA